MKFFLIIIFSFFVTNISYGATEKLYLKCKPIVTKNKSTGPLKNIVKEGQVVQIILSELILSKKSAKITSYMPALFNTSIEDEYNKKIKFPTIEKQKAKIKDNSYMGEEVFSGKPDGKQTDMIERLTLINKDNNWSAKYRSLTRTGDIDVNFTSEGKCVLVDKKYYKNIIKNGPTKEDYNF